MIRFIISLLSAVFINSALGGTFSAFMGFDPLSGAIGLNVLALSLGKVLPSGSLCLTGSHTSMRSCGCQKDPLVWPLPLEEEKLPPPPPELFSFGL